MNSDELNLGHCDRCGANAYDLWVNDELRCVTACRHHGREWHRELWRLGYWLMAWRKVPA